MGFYTKAWWTAIAMTVALGAVEVDLGALTPEQIQMYQKYQSGGMDAVKASMGGAQQSTSTSTQPRKVENKIAPSSQAPIESAQEANATSQWEQFQEGLRRFQELPKNPFLYTPTAQTVDAMYARKLTAKSKELERYSARFFGNENRPNPAAIPIPSYYIIVPQDVIGITLYGAKTDKYELRVDRNGVINIPKVGTLKVASLAYDKAVELITQRLQKAFLNTEVIVDVVEFASIQVTITGEVKFPGLYNLSSFSTIKDALIASQGVDGHGSVRAVMLKRDGKTVGIFDLYALMKYAKSEEDTLLRHGDILHVPNAKAIVALRGEVYKEALYELKEGERFDALFAYASGLRPQANREGIRLTRHEKNAHITVKTYDIESLQRLTPIDGDIVEVFALPSQNSKKVAIYGNVATEGERELPANGSLRALFAKEGITQENFFLPNTDFALAVIKRRDAATGYAMESFDLLAVLEGRSDVRLKSSDEVYIFNRAEIRQNPYLYATGDIIDANMSKYQFYKGMTLGDALGIIQFKDTLPMDATHSNNESDETKLTHIVQVDKEYVQLKRTQEGVTKERVLSLSRDATFALLPFDELHFFDVTQTHSQKSIRLYGEFHQEGTYAYWAGMTLGDALRLGGGTTDKALLQEVELIRYELNDNLRNSYVERLDLRDANFSMPLLADDEIYVRSIANWHDNVTVTLKGEVRFPGVYQIHRGEKFSSVLKRAGGFLPSAFVAGTVFTRKSVQKLQEEELKKSLDELNMKAGILAASANKAGETSADKMRMLEVIQALTQEAKNIKPIGRIAMTLSKDLELFANSPYNVTLEGGDVVYVPFETQTVTLVGEVLNTNSFVYMPNQTVWDYIRRGGGLKEGADAENIYIVKANGDAVKYWRWFFIEGNHHICKGDVIIVPKKLDVSSGMKFAQDLADIGYKLAITVASLKTIGLF